MTADRARFIVWSDRLMGAMRSDAAIVTTCARLEETTPPAFRQRVVAWVGETCCTRMLERL